MKNLYDYFYPQIKEAVSKMEQRILKRVEYSFIDDSLIIDITSNGLPKEIEILKRDVFDILGWDSFSINAPVIITTPTSSQLKIDLLVSSKSAIESGNKLDELITKIYRDDLANQILCHYCKNTIKLQDNKINETIITDALEVKLKNKYNYMILTNVDKPKYININISRAIPYGVSNINNKNVIINKYYEDKLMKMFKAYNMSLPLISNSLSNNKTIVEEFTINPQYIIGYINKINNNTMTTALHVDRLEELYNIHYLVALDMIEKNKLMICNDWLCNNKNDNGEFEEIKYIKSKLVIANDREMEYRKESIEKRNNDKDFKPYHNE